MGCIFGFRFLFSDLRVCCVQRGVDMYALVCVWRGAEEGEQLDREWAVGIWW